MSATKTAIENGSRVVAAADAAADDAADAAAAVAEDDDDGVEVEYVVDVDGGGGDRW